MRAVIVLLLLTAAPDEAKADPAAALEAGNRRFAEDRIGAALKAYAQGWSGDGSPADAALAYNAGTSALRLGRMPEALLWLRRAEAAAPGDPWVRHNLAVTRDALGSPPTPAPPLWTRSGLWAALGGVGLAWTVFGMLALGKPLRPGWLAALAVLSCATFAAGFLAARLGPRAAVLLAPCPERGEGLPAGGEVWVRPAEEGWKIHGSMDVLCPEGVIGLVEP